MASGASSAAAVMQQPSARPTLRCRPERVSGIPICLERRDFAAEMPSARFHEKENPYFLISYQFAYPATFAALCAIQSNE